MLFEQTVLGELAFGTKFRALPPDPVLDVPGAIEFFGFGGLERASPWELSQGGGQRLALAALLVGAPACWCSTSRRPGRTPTTKRRSCACSTGCASAPA